jgi:hypothetical protein
MQSGGAGRGGKGNGPPGGRKPWRGHYTNAPGMPPKELREAMVYAGVGPNYTCCMTCLEARDEMHRAGWLHCPNCPEHGDAHVGDPCPDLYAMNSDFWQKHTYMSRDQVYALSKSGKVHVDKSKKVQGNRQGKQSGFKNAEQTSPIPLSFLHYSSGFPSNGYRPVYGPPHGPAYGNSYPGYGPPPFTPPYPGYTSYGMGPYSGYAPPPFPGYMPPPSQGYIPPPSPSYGGPSSHQPARPSRTPAAHNGRNSKRGRRRANETPVPRPGDNRSGIERYRHAVAPEAPRSETRTVEDEQDATIARLQEELRRLRGSSRSLVPFTGGQGRSAMDNVLPPPPTSTSSRPGPNFGALLNSLSDDGNVSGYGIFFFGGRNASNNSTDGATAGRSTEPPPYPIGSIIEEIDDEAEGKKKE